MAQGEVVIIGADGQEHVFPAGFDPKRAASIVQQQAAPAQPGKPAIHPLAQTVSNAGDALIDVAKGAGAGFMSTVFHGGDLIRRAVGMERVIDRPEVQAGITPPDSTAGRVGFGAEQIAELAIPATRVATATRAAPLVARIGAQAATAGTVTGAQTGGDPRAIATSAALAGAVPVAGAVATPVWNAATKVLPERLYAQIFKYASDDLMKAYRNTAKGAPVSPTLAREALDKGLMGSSDDMAAYSLDKLNSLEAQLQQKAARSVMVLPEKQKYIGLLRDIEAQFGKGFFSQQAKEAGALASELQNMPGPSARATAMLKVKRLLDGLRSNSSFRADPVLAPRQEELKVAADLVRTTLHKNPALSPLIKDERIFIEALDAVVADAVKRQNSRVFGLVDAIFSASGPKGVVVAGTVKGANTPRAITGLGQALDWLHRSVSPSAVGTTTRTAAAGTGVATR